MGTPVGSSGLTRRRMIARTGATGSVVGALGGCLGTGGGGDAGTAWYTPDGERLRITIIAPSNGTWPLNAQTASATLSAFGIDVQTELKEKAAYGDAIQQSDFDLAVHVWGASGIGDHPYAYYSTEYGDDRSRVVNVDPTAVEVPMPVGDPAGTLETVDVTERVRALATAGDDATQREILAELAWIYNQHLPRLPLMTGVNRAWLTTDEWAVPPKASQWMRDNGVTGAMRNGRISTKSDATEPEFTIATRRSNPTDMQWNPYFAQQGQTEPQAVMYEPLVWQGPYPDDVDASSLPAETPELAREYAVEGDTMTVTLQDDRTWTDGDPFTAEDVATQYRLAQFLGQQTGDLWDEITVTGEYTFDLAIGHRNPDLVSELLAVPIRTKRDSRFGEWVEAFESATTDEERQSIGEEVVTTRIDDPLSYGLWRIDGVGDGRVVLLPHEGHPRSDDTDVERFVFTSIASNQKRWQSLKEGLVDGLRGSSAPRSMEAEFPDHARRLAYSATGGDAILINHGRPPFEDYRVRKALANVIDRWTNTHNAKEFVDTIEYPIGLSNRQAERYLGDGLDRYDTYGYEESKPEAAARLLREAGYSRE